MSWDITPSILTVAKVAATYSSKSIGGRPAQISDFTDFVHMFYLPYSDFFRADAFMASVIREADLPLETTVVSRLEDLPKKIYDCLDWSHY